VSTDQLLIGRNDLHESLCVGPAGRVRTMADEYARVKACTTAGEVLAVAPTLTEVWLPADEDELRARDLGAPWDWEADGDGVLDGDWPAMPTSIALGLPRATLDTLLQIEGVAVVSTVLNGDYLWVPVEAEGQVVEALERCGHRVERDSRAFDW